MNENDVLLDYFKGDDLAASVWLGKYAQDGEQTPDDMHRRMAKEFARIDNKYPESPRGNSESDKLSEYGRNRKQSTEESIFQLFRNFKYIAPQGSVMSQLGATSIGSLSNCFVVGQPEDSYGGIFKKDEEMAQLMKRRGGVGIDISTLRPSKTPTTNAAKSSTGAVSFMDRFSNTTREVAQNGRRGALMISIDIRHPDVMDFIKVKEDLTKITGANISVMVRDDFMKAVKEDKDYLLRFPCTTDINNIWTTIDNSSLGRVRENFSFEWSKYDMEYDKTYNFDNGVQIKKVKAREYWEALNTAAHKSAEPGIIFIDKHWNYSPDGAYPQYKGITTNPCFHPDTLVETEYGRVPIKDITKPTRVYSMDSDGRLVMSNASASFISKKNAETLKITLRSGSSIQVTPEHKLYDQDRGWVEAKDLSIGDRLGHLCRSRRGAKYSGVHLTTSPNRQKDQVMEHKLVFGQHEVGMDIHHIDRDTYNNSIDNLELLPHDEHSRLTAHEDNPQNHQVRDDSGKFISGEDSRKGGKVIVDMPEDLKTNVLSQFHNAIVSIEQGETTDVYDIQVEDTHCLIANNIVAHNCGEIFMQAYDACRLIALNLFSFVVNPFTDEAYVDYESLYKVAYEQMRLADNLIDLEIEKIDAILDKIVNDPESDDVKLREKSLWENIRRVASSGRRAGCGFTALGDMLAALGLKYDSDDALKVVRGVMKTKMKGELDCTIDLSVIRGSFDGWDFLQEYGLGEEDKLIGYNDFYKSLLINFPEQAERMMKYGRRNVSWSTVAPTGSLSILTQTTSGLEPLFAPFYMRRKKVNPGETDVRVDFIDDNGDSWMEFPVLHPKFKAWVETQIKNGGKIEVARHGDAPPNSEDIDINDKQHLEILFGNSPWYKSVANDINWIKRVEMQTTIQKYTTHSISSTINLPESVTVAEVSEIYEKSWDLGLKGVTVYRDGSRSGVLVTNTEKKETFEYKDAPKRPKALPVEVHTTVSQGTKWNVFVGLFNDRPYEVFATPHLTNKTELTLVKVKKGMYNLMEGDEIYAENIMSEMGDMQEAMTRLISTSLRHGADIKFIVEQLNKTSGDITSFSKAIARVLKKYIPDGTKSSVTCNDCGSDNVIFEEGCSKCLDCGSSKCG